MITGEQASAAVNAMALMIAGFPADRAARRMVAGVLFDMVSTGEQLDWLLRVACSNMRRFSLPELRAIFCARFRPADGIHGGDAETPGYTRDDVERAHFDRECRETEAKLQAWKQEAKLLPAAEPIETPVPKEWPKAVVKPRMREEDLTAKLQQIDGGYTLGLEPELPDKEPVSAPRISDAELKAAIEQAPRRSEQEKARLLAELEAELAARISGAETVH